MLNPRCRAIASPVIAVDPDGKDVIVVCVAVTTEHDPGHMVIIVSNYEAVNVQVEENGQTVTKTYYTLSETAPYLMAENIAGKSTLSATVVKALNNKSNVEAFLDNNAVVSYTMDKDQGILGSEFSDDVKDLNPDLDMTKTYFTQEEVQSELDIVGDLKELNANGPSLGYGLSETGELEATDCSTLIVDLLQGAGLVDDDDFGLTTFTEPESGLTFSTPTPTEISFDLEAMSKEKDSGVTEKINSQGRYNQRDRAAAEKFLEKTAKEVLDHLKAEGK